MFRVPRTKAVGTPSTPGGVFKNSSISIVNFYVEGTGTDGGTPDVSSHDMPEYFH